MVTNDQLNRRVSIVIKSHFFTTAQMSLLTDLPAGYYRRLMNFKIKNIPIIKVDLLLKAVGIKKEDFLNEDLSYFDNFEAMQRHFVNDYKMKKGLTTLSY